MNKTGLLFVMSWCLQINFLLGEALSEHYLMELDGLRVGQEVYGGDKLGMGILAQIVVKGDSANFVFRFGETERVLSPDQVLYEIPGDDLIGTEGFLWQDQIFEEGIIDGIFTGNVYRIRTGSGKSVMASAGDFGIRTGEYENVHEGFSPELSEQIKQFISQAPDFFKVPVEAIGAYLDSWVPTQILAHGYGAESVSKVFANGIIKSISRDGKSHYHKFFDTLVERQQYKELQIGADVNYAPDPEQLNPYNQRRGKIEQIFAGKGITQPYFGIRTETGGLTYIGYRNIKTDYEKNENDNYEIFEKNDLLGHEVYERYLGPGKIDGAFLNGHFRVKFDSGKSEILDLESVGLRIGQYGHRHEGFSFELLSYLNTVLVRAEDLSTLPLEAFISLIQRWVPTHVFSPEYGEGIVRKVFSNGATQVQFGVESKVFTSDIYYYAQKFHEFRRGQNIYAKYDYQWHESKIEEIYSSTGGGISYIGVSSKDFKGTKFVANEYVILESKTVYSNSREPVSVGAFVYVATADGIVGTITKAYGSVNTEHFVQLEDFKGELTEFINLNYFGQIVFDEIGAFNGIKRGDKVIADGRKGEVLHVFDGPQRFQLSSGESLKHRLIAAPNLTPSELKEVLP